MRRVVATLSPRRKSVTMSSRDGKTEKSSGRFTPSDTSSTRSEMPMLMASKASSARGGSGITSTATTPSTTMAKISSARLGLSLPSPGATEDASEGFTLIGHLQQQHASDYDQARGRRKPKWLPPP